MLKSVKLQMDQRKNLKSVDMVKACLAHFTTGAPIPSNDFLRKDVRLHATKSDLRGTEPYSPRDVLR